MQRLSTATPRTPSVSGGDSSSNRSSGKSQRSAFVFMALNMTWQLAVVVLVPVIGGVQLDKHFDSSIWTFVGLGVALLASGVVMWRAMQTANRLPVPKLTDEQKAAIKKSYEEDDD